MDQNCVFQIINEAGRRRGDFLHEFNSVPSPAAYPQHSGRRREEIPGDATHATVAATPPSSPPEYTEIEFKVRPSLYHLPSYEDAVKLEEQAAV